MKKNLLLLSAICFASALFAQTIPNSGFENWTNMGNYSDPDQWGTLNSTTNLAGVYTVTQGTPGNPGAYYVKITSKTVLNQVVPGIAATGVINAQTQTITGGFPYAIRSANITGNWQYMAMSGNDQGSINVVMTKWNSMTSSRDTISATQYMLPGMVMAWANFSIPLTYLMAGNPDTCMIILAASNSTPAANSYLWVDDLNFTGLIGINEVSTSPTNLSVYPNPAQNLLNVSFTLQNQENVKLELVDVTGKLIREVNPSVMQGDNTLSMDLEGIDNGIYFIRLVSNGAIETKKISIQ
jgi:hypothetical protein